MEQQKRPSVNSGDFSSPSSSFQPFAINNPSETGKIPSQEERLRAGGDNPLEQLTAQLKESLSASEIGKRTEEPQNNARSYRNIDADVQKMRANLDESYELFQKVANRLENISFGDLLNRIKDLSLISNNNSDQDTKMGIETLRASFDESFQQNKIEELTRNVKSVFTKHPGEFADIPELSEYYSACSQLERGLEFLKRQRSNVLELSDRMTNATQASFHRMEEIQQLLGERMPVFLPDLETIKEEIVQQHGKEVKVEQHGKEVKEGNKMKETSNDDGRNKKKDSIGQDNKKPVQGKNKQPRKSLSSSSTHTNSRGKLSKFTITKDNSTTGFISSARTPQVSESNTAISKTMEKSLTSRHQQAKEKKIRTSTGSRSNMLQRLPLPPSSSGLMRNKVMDKKEADAIIAKMISEKAKKAVEEEKRVNTNNRQTVKERETTEKESETTEEESESKVKICEEIIIKGY